MLSPNDMQAIAKQCDDLSYRMRELDRRFPGEPAFASILAQLAHVASRLRAGLSPVELGKELTFGFLAMKFVRDFDSALSRELAEVNQRLDTAYGTS